MSRIFGVFSEGFGWRDTSGLTCASPQTQGKSLNLRAEDSLSYSVGNTIDAGIYNFVNFTPYQYTLAFRIQHYTTGGTQYVFNYHANTGNTISVYVSGTTTYLKHVAGGTERIASGTTSAVAGTLYNLICRGDSSNTIDSTNYLKIDFGVATAITGVTASALGTLDASGETYAVGQTWRRRGEHTFRGRMWLQIDSYAWSDTEVTTFINSGVPTEPIVNPLTKFMFAGEGSTSFPKIIFYNSSGSTFTETFESGISSYVGEDATVAVDTTTPLNDLQSLEVDAVTRGGYAEKTYAVSSSTTYYMEISVKGINTEYLAVSVEGNDSGILKMDNFQADGNLQIRNITFTTEASDTSVIIRLADDLDNSAYFVNGNYFHITPVDTITGINVNNMT